MLSGCALAVADKDDIEQVGWDDLVVFSVNHNCVKQRVTPFEVRPCALVCRRLMSDSFLWYAPQIPSRMPACSGEKCICAWYVHLGPPRLKVRSDHTFTGSGAKYIPPPTSRWCTC